MRAGKACVDRLPHARTGGVEARREGRRGERPRVPALPEEGEDGKAVSRGLTSLERRDAGFPARRGSGSVGSLKPSPASAWALESRMREKSHVRFGGGPGEKAVEPTSLAAYPTSFLAPAIGAA